MVIPDRDEYSAAKVLAGRLGWRAGVLKIDYPDNIKDPAGFLEIKRRDDLNRMLAGPLS